MSDGFIFEAARISRLKGNQSAQINKLFIDYFSNNNYKELMDLVSSWKSNPLFQKRTKILSDCVTTLQVSKREFNASNVVLPTLISQIEGILNSYVKKVGIKRKGNKEWAIEFRNKTKDDDFLEFTELANDVLLDILFQGANEGKPLKTPFTFSRHKILHGEFTKYGRLDNVLRAFLILDFLNFVSTKDEK